MLDVLARMLKGKVTATLTMNWLYKCALLIAKAGYHVQWVNPIGLSVM